MAASSLACRPKATDRILPSAQRASGSCARHLESVVVCHPCLTFAVLDYLGSLTTERRAAGQMGSHWPVAWHLAVLADGIGHGLATPAGSVGHERTVRSGARQGEGRRGSMLA